MAKAKHDYNALKMEFFQSDIDEVKVFIESKFGQWKRSWNFNKNTRWWTKEKQEYKDKILAKALEKNIAKQAKEIEIPMEQLSIAKKNAVVKVIQAMMNKDLDMTDLERTIKILRTEMWLPTTYNKNDNTNTEKIEWIHIIMWWNNINQ